MDNRNVIERVSERRRQWPDEVGPTRFKFELHLTSNHVIPVMNWLDKHTTGEFILEPGLLILTNEQDAIMFKLSFRSW